VNTVNKKLMSRFFILSFSATLFWLTVIQTPNGFGQITTNWTGATSNNWGTAGNWSSATVPGSQDNVQIGLTAYRRQPAINGNVQAGSITFGGESPDTLTVNTGYTLQVNGAIFQNHAANNIAPLTLLNGAGSIVCDSMVVGNNTLPKVVLIKNTTLVSKVSSLTVNGKLRINSSTIDLLSGAITHNNAIFSLNGGQLTLNGQIYLDNFIPAYLSTLPGTKPLSKFMISTDTSLNATLILTDSNSIALKHPGYDSVDFYHHVSGTGKSIVKYTGVNQLVYTNNGGGIDTLPYTYQNLLVTTTGTKTAGSNATNNSATVGGDLTITAGNLDLQSFSSAWTVYGNFVNRATINIGSPGITFKGPSFVNANTFNYNNGMVTFSGGTQSLTDSTTAGVTNLEQVTFADTGTKSIIHGAFAIIPGGRVYLNSNVTVMVDTTGAFILRSDSTGTAAITAIPSGSMIKGIINAEWFVKGSPTSTAMRTYRLLSSPVNSNAKTDGTGVYNTHWLQGTTPYNGSIITGLSGHANGFDTTGNPTLYLYREDVNFNDGGFTTGPDRGINKIRYTDIDSIGIQKRFVLTETADSTIKLPIANGILFFFRGNKVYHNGTTGGSKISTPYNYPESVTFINKGTANQGQVQVHIYFRNDNYLSYTDSAYISNSEIRGFNSVGNPYPSSINWDNFSATDSTASIYGPGLSAKISIFDPTIQNYTTYTADSTHNRNQQYFDPSGNGSNVIYSGQGFFVQVDSASANRFHASLRFREAAKFNPPDTTGSMMLMAHLKTSLKGVPKPVSAASLQPIAKQGKIAVKSPVNQAQFLRLSLVQDANTAEIILRFQKQQKTTSKIPNALRDPDITSKTLVSLSIYPVNHRGRALGAIPLPAKSATIPLYIEVAESGTYTFLVNQIQNIPAIYRIRLLDKLTGKLTDLAPNKKYLFKIDKNNPLSYSKRFAIVITHLAKYK
jgi:trimeric autotransporter adhesin